MSLYNMVNGFKPACLIIMPMLGRKQEDYPRFRDCFVVNKKEIVIFTRVGGNNRNQGFGEEELYKDPNYIRTFDDDFDSTYGSYVFRVPEKWKKDFDAIMEDRFTDVSEEYIKYLEEFWPKISTSGIFRKVFRGEDPDSEAKPADLATNLQPDCNKDVPDTNVGDAISRSSLLAKYDKEHEGPPGRARQLIVEEPPAHTEIIYCKDCRKHNKKVGFDENSQPVWKEDACPLVSWRGKAQGHEFDYQLCAFADKRKERHDEI